MLLDILLQDGNGLDFAVKLRRNKICVPFIFLTICGHINEIKTGFELGCDDYVQKPVNMDELQLRIKRVLRSMNSGLGYFRRIGKFNYNPIIQSLFIDKDEIPLGSLESSVLNELSVVNGAIVDKKELLEKYWQSETYYTSRNLDSVIVKLRKRFKPDPTIRILSVKRHGYRLIIN
jgi:DNA-binding response OmpR family regulator